MRGSMLILLQVLLFTGLVHGQVSIKKLALVIDHQAGGKTVQLNDSIKMEQYSFSMNRMEYYLSNISLYYDGGKSTLLKDLYVLVNVGKGQYIDLNKHAVGERLDSIVFYIGIDSATNHLDPALWPASHPLSPQDPSMHWGWVSGYRFVAVEGKTGPQSLDNEFQIHSLGDKNYTRKVVAIRETKMDDQGVLRIPVRAEYTEMFRGMDQFAFGIISHGTKGPAELLLKNCATGVFYPGALSTSSRQLHTVSKQIYPNPISSWENLQCSDCKPGDNWRCYDLTGRLMGSGVWNQPTQGLQLDTPNGMYLLEIFGKDQLHAVHRVQVLD